MQSVTRRLEDRLAAARVAQPSTIYISEARKRRSNRQDKQSLMPVMRVDAVEIDVAAAEI